MYYVRIVPCTCSAYTTSCNTNYALDVHVDAMQEEGTSRMYIAHQQDKTTGAIIPQSVCTYAGGW